MQLPLECEFCDRTRFLAAVAPRWSRRYFRVKADSVCFDRLAWLLCGVCCGVGGGGGGMSLNTQKMGLNTTIFGKGVETHFESVGTHFGMLRPILKVLRPIFEGCVPRVVTNTSSWGHSSFTVRGDFLKANYHLVHT